MIVRAKKAYVEHVTVDKVGARVWVWATDRIQVKGKYEQMKCTSKLASWSSWLRAPTVTVILTPPLTSTPTPIPRLRAGAFQVSADG